MAKKLVLIVEDDEVTRDVIRHFLETADYEVAEAVDGTIGLVKAERLQPDVILLDVQMPGPDGYEVCRRLKANPKTSRIPVVFVTLVDDPALNRLAYQAGGAACIPKPFRREGLQAVLAAVLTNAERQATPKAKPGRETQ